MNECSAPLRLRFSARLSPPNGLLQSLKVARPRSALIRSRPCVLRGSTSVRDFGSTSTESLLPTLSMSLSDIEHMFRIFSYMSGWPFVICFSILSFYMNGGLNRETWLLNSSKQKVVSWIKASKSKRLNTAFKHYILPLLLTYLSSWWLRCSCRTGLEFFSKFWFIKRHFTYLDLLRSSFEAFERWLLNNSIRQLSYIVVVLASERLWHKLVKRRY